MLQADIIIPSYNSKKWIGILLKKLIEQNGVRKIIVVDDNSPDKTAQYVEENFGKNEKLKLMVRKGKAGRGSAVIRGFEECLKDPQAKYIIEMDSDLAHDPKEIPVFLNQCQKYDAVFGSRYLKKDSTKNYPVFRKIFSFLANRWEFLILGINITDYTSGFRCYRREVLESIDFGKIQSKGFIVLSEIAYKIKKNGFKIGEIPITVVYHKGESNFNLKEIFEAFFSVLRIRFNS